MWQQLGNFVIRNRIILLVLFAGFTIFMGYRASKVKLSYEFSKAIPVDNQKYKDYVSFKEMFGDDGNMLVVGIKTDLFFSINNFQAYRNMENKLRSVSSVESILGIPSSITLLKDTLTEKLKAVKIFDDTLSSQQQLNEARNAFLNLPFYRYRLYNPETNAYLLGVRINKDVLNSKGRSKVVADIVSIVNDYRNETKTDTYVSGLPLIRTMIADRVQSEMKLFLFASIGLSILILLIFFRSLSATLLSITVVATGVIWSLALIDLFGYKITLLTALIPSLVVVIGIPNCIYFINKYHTSYLESGDKRKSLIDMVSKMGIVTLFCNITAAIGFAVFSFTSSAILKEFGVVAGISIIVIFVVSFILLPSVLSMLPAPKKRHLKYLDNKIVTRFLSAVQNWVFNYRNAALWITGIVLIISIAGIFQLKTIGFIVDDLPKKDKIYTDLKFFEKHFKGVMPLEIVIDTKIRNGLAGLRALPVFEKVDSLSTYINGFTEMSRPLSIAEGLKFAKQGFYEMDSTQYLIPNSFDGAFVGEYLRPGKSDEKNNLSAMLMAFMDSNRQYTRLSVNMADVGTEQLPMLVDSVRKRSEQLFDTSKYQVTLTGSSVTFLEGSRFIINGLKESIAWAFLLIAVCMLYLFKSARILVCSLIPNLIPLVITAGIMGWVGLPLKPSTVLIFSVALGIAVDITIRFLVNYKQELPKYNNDIPATVAGTIQHTGLSIVYTSLVLTIGFVVFCASSFGGTVSLGWLTSLTFITATLTNLVLLPILILMTNKKSTGK